MKKFFLFLLLTTAITAEGINLTGHVRKESDKKAPSLATIAVVETRQKVYTDEDGAFVLLLPKPGFYTFIIKSEGLKPSQRKIQIDKSTSLDFYLESLSVAGATIILKDTRDIQKVSRYTLTAEELKSVPAAFGDSVSALTSLPGIIRTGGFFGRLVIRGANPNANVYLIDDIPVFYPLHFGGLHSIISSNLMSEIDVYSSAFPAQFSNGYGALIHINTIDNVKNTSGYANASMLSIDGLISGTVGGKNSDTKPGYWVLSGRRSHFELIIPLLIDQAQVPKYYDYQAKGKYFLHTDHSLTLFFFGGADRFLFLDTEEQKKQREADGNDPLFNGIQFESKSQFHNQSLTYKYQPSQYLENKFIFYSALNNTLFFIDNPSQAQFNLRLNVSSKPNILGVKNKFKFEYWRDLSEIRLGASASLYKFRSNGRTLVPKSAIEFLDLSDPNVFFVKELDESPQNISYGGYLENKFTYGGLTILPGLRGDYLDRTNETLLDIRGMASYEFFTETTLSLAGGQYSSFLQTNPDWFVTQPEVASADYIQAEKAWHRTAALEQIYKLFTFRAEFFYNSFSNLMVTDPHTLDGEERLARNSGMQINKGIEIMVRKDHRGTQLDYFGWLSYTYTNAKSKSGLPLSSDSQGDTFLANDFEQEHAVKLVLGVSDGPHTVSIRLDFYTSFPYTPIIGSTGPDSLGRYVPVLTEKRNSGHFDPSHRLDLRYSYQTNYEWGYLSWYIEIINVTGFKPVSNEVWRYNQPYQSGVNPRIDTENGIGLFPNFGVEVKF